MAHTAVAITLASSTRVRTGVEHERRGDGLVAVLAGDAEHAHDRGEDLDPEVAGPEELAPLVQ